MTRRVAMLGGGGLALAAAIQLTVPERRNPATEPAARVEAQADIPPAVAASLRRACYDCHSNETRWPWYSRVAPAAWLVARDVDNGRGQLNFSRWAAYHPFDRADLLDAACRLASMREMPPRAYVLMHPDARLSEEEVATLCAWTSDEAGRLVEE